MIQLSDICSLKLFRGLARDCFATLSKVKVISELHPGIILFVMKIAIDGFQSDVIKLQSKNSEVLRILIYTRLKIDEKRNLCTSFQHRSMFHFENTAI